MPRINPLSKNAEATRRVLLNLRTTSRMSRTEFSLLIGVGTTTLANWELGRIAWPREKARIALDKLNAHALQLRASLDRVLELTK